LDQMPHKRPEEAGGEKSHLLLDFLVSVQRTRRKRKDGVKGKTMLSRSALRISDSEGGGGGGVDTTRNSASNKGLVSS